MVDELEQKL
jgi:hypothetical protein